jgi:exopolysaccharide biosynthesis polyprenyl glycosylphosphotransferase
MSTAEVKLLEQPRPTLVLHRTERAGVRAAARVLGAWGVGMVLADVCVIVGAFLLAYWARFVVPDAAALALGIENYARVGLIVGVVTVVMLASHGLYDPEQPPSWAARLRSVVSSVSTGLMVAFAASFVAGDQSYSRLWSAGGWLVAVIGMLIWHSCAHRIFTILRDSVAPSLRVLIVGANPLGEELARELSAVNHVVGFVDNGTDLDHPSRFPLLGSISQTERLVQTHAVDELVIALPVHRRDQLNRVLERGFQRRVGVKLVPEIKELQQLLPRQWQVHDVAGRRYIGFWSAARVTWLKRAMDLLLATIGLLVVSPLFAVIAIAIKLDSCGPIFYGQTRVGRNGRQFTMLKFRSMVQDADRRLAELRARNEASGPLFKMRQDPRITRVGGFLRRWSFDELPQLINILRGEMSLVGPRPPIPSEVAEYEDWQLGRLRAVPGLTGLWQVSGRSEVPFHDMVRLDLHYIRNWTFGLDLEILLRTIPAVLTNRGAY